MFYGCCWVKKLIEFKCFLPCFSSQNHANSTSKCFWMSPVPCVYIWSVNTWSDEPGNHWHDSEALLVAPFRSSILKRPSNRNLWKSSKKPTKNWQLLYISNLDFAIFETSRNLCLWNLWPMQVIFAWKGSLPNGLFGRCHGNPQFDFISMGKESIISGLNTFIIFHGFFWGPTVAYK